MTIDYPRYFVSKYTKREFCKFENKYIKNHIIKKCKKCKNIYMKEWRKNHPLSEDQKIKGKTRSYVSVYFKRGILKKEKCLFCGSTKKLEFHHTDYTKPLKVICLCRNCHLEIKKTNIEFKEKDFCILNYKINKFKN